jgi:hypothetical protein
MSRIVTTVGVLIAATVGVTHATVVAPVSFREAVTEAALIVRGHVTDLRAVELTTGVETAVTLAVDRVLKGAAADFVTVRVPGGTIGRYRYVFVGAPTFTPNEQVILLLKRGSDNALRPIGLWQGVYRVEAMPGTGQPAIAAPAVAPQTAATGQVVRGDTRRKLISVTEFESLVRLVMAAPTQGGQR